MEEADAGGALNSRGRPTTRFDVPPPTRELYYTIISSCAVNRVQYLPFCLKARGSPGRGFVRGQSIIDLTNEDDDEELQKAINLSVSAQNVENEDTGGALRRSDREDHNQSWAMVPVKVTEADNTQSNNADDDLRRAMEASLSYHDRKEPVFIEDRTRIELSWYGELLSFQV